MTDQSCMDGALVEPVEGLKWSNSDNDAFYEGIKVDGLKALAERSGLADGYDMELLTPYWSTAKSVLEVGAGYGRVIDYLLKHQFVGEITAIERCKVLFDYLSKRFCQYGSVDLLQNDVRYLNELGHCFDLILLLWGSICNFSPCEQSMIIGRLAKCLKNNGKLIIDSPPVSSLPNGSARNGASYDYLIKTDENSTMTFHAPSDSEISSFMHDAGLSNLSHFTYQTKKNYERKIYILS